MRNAGLDEAQAGIKTARRNVNNLRYTDGTTLKAECEEQLKYLLMKVKKEREKAGLKLNIQKTKLCTEEFMFLNCGVGEDSSESLGLQDQTSPS